jgi:hypothetical protein
MYGYYYYFSLYYKYIKEIEKIELIIAEIFKQSTNVFFKGGLLAPRLNIIRIVIARCRSPSY